MPSSDSKSFQIPPSGLRSPIMTANQTTIKRGLIRQTFLSKFKLQEAKSNAQTSDRRGHAHLHIRVKDWVHIGRFFPSSTSEDQSCPTSHSPPPEGGLSGLWVGALQWPRSRFSLMLLKSFYLVFYRWIHIKTQQLFLCGPGDSPMVTPFSRQNAGGIDSTTPRGEQWMDV